MSLLPDFIIYPTLIVFMCLKTEICLVKLNSTINKKQIITAMKCY